MEVFDTLSLCLESSTPPPSSVLKKEVEEGIREVEMGRMTRSMLEDYLGANEVEAELGSRGGHLTSNKEEVLLSQIDTTSLSSLLSSDTKPNPKKRRRFLLTVQSCSPHLSHVLPGETRFHLSVVEKEFFRWREESEKAVQAAVLLTCRGSNGNQTHPRVVLRSYDKKRRPLSHLTVGYLT